MDKTGKNIVAGIFIAVISGLILMQFENANSPKSHASQSITNTSQVTETTQTTNGKTIISSTKTNNSSVNQATSGNGTNINLSTLNSDTPVSITISGNGLGSNINITSGNKKASSK